MCISSLFKLWYQKMFTEFILFIFVFSKCYNGDKYHIVASGPCVNKDKDYCARSVPNSFCSTEKDECFCQNGFVAIKEQAGLICKTLLTNLKCSVDRDCNDVAGSSCHPGPGQCSCPAETFYVPQEHNCKYYSNNSSICKACKSFGGDCYTDAEVLISKSRKMKRKEYRCSCPGILYTPEVIYNQIQKVPNLELCKGIMVDLGSFCNDFDIICRPKVSECVYSNILRHKICSCPQDHVAIYQNHLKYYECYPKVDRISKFCDNCQGTNGVCVDMNTDGSEDACQCSRWNSVAHLEEVDVSKPICNDDLATVKCSSMHLEVCISYKKFLSDKMYSSSQYTSGVFSTRFPEKEGTACYVSSKDKNKQYKCFYLQRHFDTKMFESNCSSVTIGADKSIYHRVNLIVRKSEYFSDPINDLLFHISCKTEVKASAPSYGQITDKSWYGNLNSVENSLTIPDSLFSFQLIDVRKNQLTRINTSQMFAIDIYLRKESRTFTTISPEECSVEQVNSRQIIYSRLKSISLSSPNANSDFNFFSFTSIPIEKPIGTYRIRSNFFPAFILKVKGKVTLNCVLRICHHSSWCKIDFSWKLQGNREMIIPKSYDDIKFTTVQTDVIIGDENCCTGISVAKENKIQCSDLLCLTPAQILTIVISVCTLAIMLSFIAILMFKKTRGNNYINCSRQKPKPENNDRFELSTVKPNSSTFQRFSLDDLDDDENQHRCVANKFAATDHQMAEMTASQHNVTLAKEYDFYVNLSALNSPNRPSSSKPFSLLDRTHVYTDTLNPSARILENRFSFFGNQPPLQIQHHVCPVDNQNSFKCSKSTAV